MQNIDLWTLGFQEEGVGVKSVGASAHHCQSRSRGFRMCMSFREDAILACQPRSEAHLPKCWQAAYVGCLHP